MEELPDELWLEIFQWTHPFDVRSLILVNRRSHRMLQQKHFWRAKCRLDYPVVKINWRNSFLTRMIRDYIDRLLWIISGRYPDDWLPSPTNLLEYDLALLRILHQRYSHILNS